MIGVFQREFSREAGELFLVVQNDMPTVAYMKWLEKKIQDGRLIALNYRGLACATIGKQIDRWLYATEEAEGPRSGRERVEWLEARLKEGRLIALSNRDRVRGEVRKEINLWLGKSVPLSSVREDVDPLAWLDAKPRQPEVENVLAWLDQ